MLSLKSMLFMGPGDDLPALRLAYLLTIRTGFIQRKLPTAIKMSSLKTKTPKAA